MKIKDDTHRIFLVQANSPATERLIHSRSGLKVLRFEFGFGWVRQTFLIKWFQRSNWDRFNWRLNWRLNWWANRRCGRGIRDRVREFRSVWGECGFGECKFGESTGDISGLNLDGTDFSS